MVDSLVFPGIKWAQRKDKVWITIELIDMTDSEIDLTEEGVFTFKAESGGQKYGFVMNLFNKINKETSGWSLKGRNAVFKIMKVDDDQEEYWPRLTKEKAKNHKIAIDFAKWVDEDEADEAPDLGGDMDMNQFGGQGGMPGMGGMGGMPGMGGMGGMEGMMGGMGGMGGMPGMEGMGGMGGMDMAKLQEMMAGMQGGHGHDHGHDHDHGDSDDEDEEEAEGAPHKAGGLDDLEGDAEKPVQE